MSAEFFLRIFFMILFAILGGIWGHDLARYNPEQVYRYTLGIALVGALTGLVLTPYFTTRPTRAVRRIVGKIAAETLFAGLAGLIIGLLTAALLAFPLSLLPRPFGSITPFLGVVVFGYLGISLFVMRLRPVRLVERSFRGRLGLLLDEPEPDHLT